MTQPIQEPNTQRSLSQKTWADNQLFRRPAPVTESGAEVPWIRCKQLDLGQDLTGGNIIILYDDVCNPYPDFFDFDTVDGYPAIVNPKVSGLYQATVRLFFDTFLAPFDEGIEVNFSGVDWDEYLYYSSYIFSFDTTRSPMNSSGGGYAEVMFRGGEDAEIGPWEIYVHTEIPGAVSETVLLENNGGGTYMEVRYLGADPLFPDGLSNFDFECST